MISILKKKKDRILQLAIKFQNNKKILIKNNID